MLKLLGAFLDDGGILIAGTNGNNLQARYAVYRKNSDEIQQVEFAFSLDNLRPLGLTPWFTIHENDPEAFLLAELTGKIRNDQKFCPVSSPAGQCHLCSGLSGRAGLYSSDYHRVRRPEYRC